MSNYYRILFADFIEENSETVEIWSCEHNVIFVDDLLNYLDELEKGSK